MNEETIFGSSYYQKEKLEGQFWKPVTLGGIAGILMGAGVMRTIDSKAIEASDVDTIDENIEDVNNLHVAEVDENQSFAEAFASARAEVGPGGVFHWHGGIYNTYTFEEWNAMSTEDKANFAQLVRPEVRPYEISTPTDDHPNVNIHSTVVSNDETAPDLRGFELGGDVHIVGYTDIEEHLVVGYDTTGDGQADIAIIDVDSSGAISNPDIVFDANGNHITVGDIVNDHSQEAGYYQVNNLDVLDNTSEISTDDGVMV